MRCRTCSREIPAGAPCPTCSPRPKTRLVGALLEQRGDDPGGVYGLREGRNKLGRDGGCDIVVQDARASGDHAYLFVGDDGSASLTDVSRNGTLVDGNPVQGGTARLDHGSVVQIGAVRLTVLLTPP